MQIYLQALNAFSVLQPLALVHNRYLWGPSSEYHPDLSDAENDDYKSKWSVATHITQLMSSSKCHNEQTEVVQQQHLHLFCYKTLDFILKLLAKKPTSQTKPQSLCWEQVCWKVTLHLAHGSSLEIQCLESSKHLPSNIYQHGSRCLRDTFHFTFHF